MEAGFEEVRPYFPILDPQDVVEIFKIYSDQLN